VPLDRLQAILRRKGAYRDLFKGPVSNIVLADLAHFCRAYKTTHAIGDPTGSAQLEGRRQVWLRIQEHIHASDAHIRRLIEQEQGLE
jgi:hypothetical protein